MQTLTMEKNAQGTWEIKLPEIAELQQGAGILEGITKFEIFSIPIGAAAGGLLIVGLMDALRGLIGGVLPAAIPQWMLPAIGAGLVNTKMVKGWIGEKTANAAGIILLADAFQASPINPRALISGALKGLSLPAALGQTMNGTTVGGNGHKVVTSLEEYNAAKGIT